MATSHETETLGEERADVIVRSVIRALGYRPRNSLVLLVVDGMEAGPCLRVDLPYGSEDMDAFGRQLVAQLPGECAGKGLVLLCFEDTFGPSPEWYRQVFLGVCEAADEAGLVGRGILWVASSGAELDAGRSEEPAEERDEAAEGPEFQRAMRAVEDVEERGPVLTPAARAQWREALGPLFVPVDAAVREQYPLSASPLDVECPRLLGVGLLTRQCAPGESMGAAASVLVVEALEHLLTVMGREHLDEPEVSLPASAVSLFLGAIVLPSGLELVLRAALGGRTAALDCAARRHVGVPAFGRVVPPEATALAELLVDPPEDPWSAGAWWSRSGTLTAEEGLGPREAAVMEDVQGSGDLILTDTDFRAALSIGGLEDALRADVPSADDDVDALRRLALLLAQVAPPYAARRLHCLVAWSLWAQGDAEAAHWHLEFTRNVRGLLDDPWAEVLGALFAHKADRQRRGRGHPEGGMRQVGG
ncbi:DUF4192 family protein [Falsarthrobacter nasiphocae]|uniref:DUF4192 family protein n=1 Tax=Falsarthrobacter nasiphocae TaxID=189863 RepID=A0AAE3YG29_9MICC|nr:DUF4192 family protein [Falsarthrobacter nasiphocae]MDR6891283.1 hypothetical protein [Falsarthrobacter nasiphocae]